MVGGALRIAGRFAHRRAQRERTAIFAPYAHGPVPFSQLLEVFDRSAVCLNFSNVWDGSRARRSFRMCASGISRRRCAEPATLTGHTDEITEFYDVGTEIDTYRTPGELIDKTRFYLANPAAAEQLREGGYRRASAITPGRTASPNYFRRRTWRATE
jgi:hypothetical protein